MVTKMKSRNKAFWAKTKSQQRVAVAKDVIKQLEDKFLIAESGTYFNIRNLNNDIVNPSVGLDDVFSELKKDGASCQVCGIGGCFVSLVNLGDNAKTREFIFGKVEDGDSISQADMRQLLRKVFTSRHLTLIECAFEQSAIHQDLANKYVSYKERNSAARFALNIDKDKKRLIAIMKNIIKNKGEFIPQQITNLQQGS